MQFTTWMEAHVRPDSSVAARTTSREGAMLWTIAVILLVLWALGLVSSYTAGGFVHLLLVIAVIVIVFQFVSGRRSV
jgi:predicted ferric reductase